MIKLINSLSLDTVILLPVTMSVFKVMLMTQSFFLYGVLFLFFKIVLLFIFLSSIFFYFLLVGG